MQEANNLPLRWKLKDLSGTVIAKFIEDYDARLFAIYTRDRLEKLHRFEKFGFAIEEDRDNNEFRLFMRERGTNQPIYDVKQNSDTTSKEEAYAYLQ